jgi:hypothetical protein
MRGPRRGNSSGWTEERRPRHLDHNFSRTSTRRLRETMFGSECRDETQVFFPGRIISLERVPFRFAHRITDVLDQILKLLLVVAVVQDLLDLCNELVIPNHCCGWFLSSTWKCAFVT